MNDLFDVSGKVAVVTGGSRGIGEMIAHGLVENGCRVYIASRKEEDLRATADELGDACVPVPADLSSEEGCVRLAEAVAAEEDEVHILVNNAGATWGAPLEEFPQVGWDKVLDVNVKAVFYLTRALLPRLRAAATHEDPARVVNIGSVDGIQVPMFESYSYSTSKAAVHQLTRHLGRFLADDDITVNAIAPGFFPSRMTAFMQDSEIEEEFVRECPRGRLGEPEDIAGTVIWLSSRAGAYVTGTVIVVDGGYVTLR